MSSERPRLPESFHDGSASTPNIAFSDGETASDEDDVIWFPGDGVCPRTSQFSKVYLISYNVWKSAASKFTRRSVVDSFRVDSFLDLLQDVPPFFHDPPKNVDLRGRSNGPLTLHSSLHLGTTEDSSCDQSWKSIDYFQYFGFSKPVTFRQTESLSLLTNIILAWSYILSSRWVEILQHSGMKCSLTHIQGKHLSAHFWTLVTKIQWTTQVEIDTQTFYAPWMLRNENNDTEKRCVQFRLPSY